MSASVNVWRANGAGVYGEFAQGLSYRAYVLEGLLGSKFSASSGIRGGRQKGSQANADDLALAARVDYEGVPGLLVGASVYAGNSGAGATDSLGAEIDAGSWAPRGGLGARAAAEGAGLACGAATAATGASCESLRVGPERGGSGEASTEPRESVEDASTTLALFCSSIRFVASR